MPGVYRLDVPDADNHDPAVIATAAIEVRVERQA